LDDRLQGDGKIPRWEPRSRVAVYLGHSPHHAQSVALVLNLSTGHVSPQFHLVFDNDFTTVNHLKLGTVPTNWPELFENSRELATTHTYQLHGDWTKETSTQPSIQWLSAAVDSQPTMLDSLLDSSSNLPSREDEILDNDINALQNEGVPQNEGAHIESYDRAIVEQTEGALQHLDPLTGEESSPSHNFTVNFDASLQMPNSINFAEAGLRRSSRERRATDRLISNPFFGLSAIR
jgi:hypothetical protein